MIPEHHKEQLRKIYQKLGEARRNLSAGLVPTETDINVRGAILDVKESLGMLESLENSIRAEAR